VSMGGRKGNACGISCSMRSALCVTRRSVERGIILGFEAGECVSLLQRVLCLCEPFQGLQQVSACRCCSGVSVHALR